MCGREEEDERTSLQGGRAGGRRGFPLLGHYKNSRIEKSRERGGERGARRAAEGKSKSVPGARVLFGAGTRGDGAQGGAKAKRKRKGGGRAERGERNGRRGD